MQDNANDKTEAEDQPGLMEENEVAEQMEAQDFLQPQAEQPELEVPEDLNLDNEAMDQEDGDGEAADTEADASEQNIPEEEDPSTAPDLGAFHRSDMSRRVFADPACIQRY